MLGVWGCCNVGCASLTVWRCQGWVGSFCGGLRPPHLPYEVQAHLNHTLGGVPVSAASTAVPGAARVGGVLYPSRTPQELSHAYIGC